MNDKLQQVNEQIADLEARRQALHKNQKKARETVKEQEAVMYGVLIDGGAADKPIETVTREKARDEAITQAEKELDARIAKLQAEREKIEREIAIADYEQAVAGIRKQLYTCAGRLYKFVEAMNAVTVPGKPRDYTPTKEAKLTRNMLDQFRQLDLYRTLVEFERIAPDFMAQARKQEGIK